MRLLDRYLLRELLIPFGYCLMGFLIFWISSDIMGEVDTFQRARLKPADVAYYYVIKTPEWLVFPIIPAAWLLGLLYALVHHARHNELIAMRAAGVSIWRLAVPYLVLGVILSMGLLAVNELWVPRSQEEVEAVLNRYTGKQKEKDSKRWVTKLTFTNARDKRTWVVEAYDRQTTTLWRPHVSWVLATGTRCDISAERAIRTNDTWMFLKATELVFPAIPGAVPLPEQKEVRLMPEFTETPEQIESEIKIGQMNNLRAIRKGQLSVAEILNYKRLHPEDSPNMDMLDTKLHGRLAAPWTCVVIVLIALPFGAMTGRRNVFAGVSSSIVICFIYFVLLQIGLAVGARGFVYPWLAAWFPNILFAVGGTYMTWKFR
jgi:lipopolysaccharide export system permease protein